MTDLVLCNISPVLCNIPTHQHYFLSPAGCCSSMDVTQYFKKEIEKSYRSIIPVPVTDDDTVIQEKERRASSKRFQWSGQKSELSAERY